METLASSGRFLAASMNFLRVGGQELDVLAGPVLQHEGHPARGADTHDGRWREGKADGAGEAAHFLVRRRLDRLVLLFRLLSLGPVLQGDEEEGAVGIGHLAEHAVADDRGAVLDPRGLRDDFFGLPGHFAGPLQRGGIGQLDAGKDEPLVLVREKTDGAGACRRIRPGPPCPPAGGD